MLKNSQQLGFNRSSCAVDNLRRKLHYVQKKLNKFQLFIFDVIFKDKNYAVVEKIILQMPTNRKIQKRTGNPLHLNIV